MSTIWKQKYLVTFELNDEIEVRAVVQATDKEEYTEDQLKNEAKEKILQKTGLQIKELKTEFETIVFIDEKNSTYLAARWLYEDGRSPDNYDWTDYQDGINGSGVDEDKVDFDGMKECLQMIWILEEDEN